MNEQTLLEILEVSIIASVISSQIIQKIKETFALSKFSINIISIFISFVIGFGYGLTFYSSNLLYAIWIGLFTLIEARGLYKMFKGSFGLESAVNKNKKE